MATQVERLTTVVEGLTGTVPDIDLLIRIAARFESHWQAEFDSSVADPDAPTNAERAGFALLKMRQFGQAILRSEAIREHRESVADAGTAAGDAAAGEF